MPFPVGRNGFCRLPSTAGRAETTHWRTPRQAPALSGCLTGQQHRRQMGFRPHGHVTSRSRLLTAVLFSLSTFHSGHGPTVNIFFTAYVLRIARARRTLHQHLPTNHVRTQVHRTTQKAKQRNGRPLTDIYSNNGERHGAGAAASALAMALGCTASSHRSMGVHSALCAILQCSAWHAREQ